MKTIELTKGYKTIVDDVWFDSLVNDYNSWNADLDRTTGNHYAVCKVRIDGKRVKFRMHRVVIGALPGQIVDHINRNTLDNRLENLRIVTNSQNRMNIVRKNLGTSKYKGVYWSKQYGKFIAQIRKNKIGHRLGMFDSEAEAAECYNANAKVMFGEFAKLNEIV